MVKPRIASPGLKESDTYGRSLQHQSDPSPLTDTHTHTPAKIIMKTFTTSVLALAFVSSAVARNLTVVNNCAFTIWYMGSNGVHDECAD